MKTELLPSDYLELYKRKQPITVEKHFNRLSEKPFNKETFDFSNSMAAVYSSMIEGNNIDFDSYLNFSETGMNTNSNSFREIKDLKKAYEFAHKSVLNLQSFLEAHKILSKTVINNPAHRGTFRNSGVIVGNDFITIYIGPAPEKAKVDTEALFVDICVILAHELSIAEVFYFASMIHLVFVKIHPFVDGNGRSARLLEKWFLSSKLGDRAWLIKSERLYQSRINAYFKNIDIGADYFSNNYELCIPFLLMLPMAFTNKL